MSFEADEEILQDFLVEAGEILEQLNEQMVELEQRPNDSDLLNAVFRGFHTIKGGASFLNLTPLVEVCHVAEDVFNLLRNGEREVDSQLMDIMLPVLDSLNGMFDSVRSGVMPDSADPALIEALKSLLLPPGEVPVPTATLEAPQSIEALSNEPEAAAVPAAGGDADDEFESMLNALDGGEESGAGNDIFEDLSSAPISSDADDITDEEFAALLDELGGAPAQEASTESVAAASPASSTEAGNADIIQDDEFEALLDSLHGKGQAPGLAETTAEAASIEDKPSAASSSTSAEEINEDEFEALLDKIHGKGQAPGLESEAGSVPSAAAAESKTTPPKPQAQQPAAASAKPALAAAAKPKQEVQAVQAETTVRVDTKRLDDIMNMVGELVLVRNRLVNLESSLENDELAKAVGNLDVVTADLQTSVMKTRMQPIKKVFGRFPRVVRDLARSLNKEVTLELVGEETDLDKNLVEALADPLVHLVRNAVDHGVEMPDVREAAGKERKGTVILSAEQEGDHILLSIEDDGGGMDAEVLRKKVVEKGLMDSDAAARMDEKECFNLIFMPGFSTKAEISDISGRGVGMDVVKTRIAQLNGSIDIDSVQGEGTRLTIKVPLTLAIIPTLMIMLGDQTFALPLVSVNEIFNLDLSHTNVIDGQLVIMLRDAPLPLFYLNNWLVDHKTKDDVSVESHVVVVHVGNQKVGFVVDQLIGQEEVVIKPLGALLHNVQGLAGATITGDGKIALILDVPGLLKRYAKKFQH